MAPILTRGQFWPLGIVTACVCLCVCLSIHVSIIGLGGGGGGGGGGNWPWPSGSNLTLKVKFYPIVSLKFVRVVSHHPFKGSTRGAKELPYTDMDLQIQGNFSLRSFKLGHVDKTLTRMLTWSVWGTHDSTNSTNWARNSFTVILWHGDRLWSTCLFTIENGSLDVVILLDITKFLLDRCHHTLWM